eukprot:1140355-Pelagomonas_calceolata.AAC.2
MLTEHSRAPGQSNSQEQLPRSAAHMQQHVHSCFLVINLVKAGQKCFTSNRTARGSGFLHQSLRQVFRRVTALQGRSAYP